MVGTLTSTTYPTERAKKFHTSEFNQFGGCNKRLTVQHPAGSTSAKRDKCLRRGKSSAMECRPSLTMRIFSSAGWPGLAF